MAELTEIKTYALVVDGVFASEYSYPSVGSYTVEKTTAILNSNPKVVITSGSPSNNINIYNLLIDNEVVGQIHYPDSGDTLPEPSIVNEALKSDPTIIDITGLEKPSIGDVWDGTAFTTPENQE